MRRLVAFAAVLVIGAVIAGGVALATRHRGPPSDPGPFAIGVVRMIVSNRYAEAWDDLHPVDRRVASRKEYVACENRSPLTATFVRARVAKVSDEAVGLGDGRFVHSKAIDVLITLRDAGVDPFVVRHTMHVVASGSKWTWILPPSRYAEFRANRCSTAPQSATSES